MSFIWLDYNSNLSLQNVAPAPGGERVPQAQRVREAAAAGASVRCSHAARGRVQGAAEHPPAAAPAQGRPPAGNHRPARKGGVTDFEN